MAKGSRLSVAELAGRFTSQAPLSKEDEVNKPVRRRPPRTLPLPASNDVGQGQVEQKAEAGSHPPRKNRNSALVEKLEASLSPTALLPSPLSPGAGKPLLPFFPAHSPSSPVSPTAASKPTQTETPASFETPAEGTVLLNINKGRARHSIKRRPPSRRHRKSSEEEGLSVEEKTTVSGPTTPDGKENDVFEKQKLEQEGIDGTDSVSATSKQQQDQEQSEASVDSEQQPVASTEGAEEESRECVVSAEKEETEEEEKKSEQPELDGSKEESAKEEPGEVTPVEAESEPATAAEDKIEKDVRNEEEDERM